MNVTRDVITDLLPIYLAGEASAGTRVLLEEYLRDNPDFAAEMHEQLEKSAALLTPAAVALSPDHEKVTFERIRRFNRRRTHLLAFAIAWTLIPLSFAFADGWVNWIMLRDNPKAAVYFWIAAAACWVGYYLMGRRMRSHAAA